ncbi:MAG TPA: hypothetical protein VLU46_08520 [Thermoanaerobaculia bacterium]|nr:hypothetical protein [Thermoanaerobaculia bacterium]
MSDDPEVLARLDRLEQRVATLERSFRGGQAPAPVLPAAVQHTPVHNNDLSVDIGLAGTSVLILGGAYLLRALTESAAMPQIIGVVLGLAYAAVWVWNADRAVRRGRSRAAVFNAATASVIAFPLAWETTARFHIISPEAGGAVVAVLATALLWLAWRDEFQAIGWIANIGAVITSIMIAWTTKTLVPLMLAVSFVGAATLHVSYTRKWDWMVWPPLLASDGLAFVTLGVAAFHNSGYTFGTVVVAIALFAAMWLGVIAVRRLARNEEASLIDAIQTAEVVLLGVGGATYVAAVNHAGAVPLGIILIVTAAAMYFVSLGTTRDTAPRLRVYFGILAAVFTAFGSWLLIPKLTILGLVWAVMAVTMTEIARRTGSLALRIQSGIWLVGSAFISGLMLATLSALIDAEAKNIEAPAVAVIVSALALAPLFRTASRAIRTIALAIVTCGAFITASTVLAASIAPHERMTLALIRTGVLAGIAAVLAAASRFGGVVEAGTIARGVLVIGGIKLLAEDVRVGGAAMLVAAFAAYGCAMLLVSRSAPRQAMGSDL